MEARTKYMCMNSKSAFIDAPTVLNILHKAGTKKTAASLDFS